VSSLDARFAPIALSISEEVPDVRMAGGRMFTDFQCMTTRRHELELELIQTQMTQKPMLRAEVYAHAMRASQNRKWDVRREKEV